MVHRTSAVALLCTALLVRCRGFVPTRRCGGNGGGDAYPRLRVASKADATAASSSSSSSAASSSGSSGTTYARLDERTGKATGLSFLPADTVARAAAGSPVEKVKLEKDGTSAFVDVYEYARRIREGTMTWEDVDKADLDSVRWL